MGPCENNNQNRYNPFYRRFLDTGRIVPFKLKKEGLDRLSKAADNVTYSFFELAPRLCGLVKYVIDGLYISLPR